MFDSRNWLTGITDGEGSFIMSIENQKVKHRSGNITENYMRIHLRFTITLRKDDLLSLLKIQNIIGTGRIYHSSPKTIKGRNPNPTSCLSIRGTKQCHEFIVPHFTKFPLQTKKARDFEIWKQAVAIMFKKSQRRRTGMKYREPPILWLPGELEEIKMLCAALKSARLYREPQLY